MKKSIYIILLIVLMLTITGCNTKEPSKTVTKETTKEKQESGIRDKSQWQEYANSRFDYSIDFPKTWDKGNDSQNNDGVILYLENESFDVRVYGSNYLEDFSKPYINLQKDGFTKKDIELDGGQTATLITGQEDNMMIFEMVLISNRIEYHFYAKVSKEYANEYGDVILDVIRTFDPRLDVMNED